jgi:hypothetical protein
MQQRNRDAYHSPYWRVCCMIDAISIWLHRWTILYSAWGGFHRCLLWVQDKQGEQHKAGVVRVQATMRAAEGQHNDGHTPTSSSCLTGTARAAGAFFPILSKATTTVAEVPTS